MKLIVSSSELLKGILMVAKAIPSKSADAILEDYLFVLKGDTLRITASDNELTLITDVKVSSTLEEGKMAVPAKQLTDLLKELPDQPLTISTSGDNSFVCSWESGESTLPFFNPDDYPQIQTAGEGASTMTISEKSLADGIAGTIYAASDEANRQIMNSIFFDIKADSATLVASDLQKLICYMANDIKADGECSFILNKRHASVIKSILSKDDEEVKITFNQKVAVFSFGDTTAVCTLVSGKYPAYRTIIPQNNSFILEIDRLRLLNTVKRIAVCSPKASNHIKFELAADTLKISAQDTGFEIAAHESIACKYDGDDLTIGFKSTHIIEILSNLSCEQIIMKFADKRHSALILPSEDEASSEKIFGLVMPILVH